jgi:hypothetical protein
MTHKPDCWNAGSAELDMNAMTEAELKEYLLSIWRAGYAAAGKDEAALEDFKRRLRVKIDPQDPNKIEVWMEEEGVIKQ